MKKIKIALLGIGRIGKIHFDTIRQYIPEAEVVAVSAARRTKEEFAKEYGTIFFTNNAEEAIKYPGVDAVLICTSTSTHAALLELCIAEGKHVFCEKPMDLSLERTTALTRLIEKYPKKVMLAFNRRFDPDMMHAKKSVAEGKVGNVQLVKITSRDPGLPSADFLKTSGGLFLDMVIHDFDMARYITGKEVIEVYSKGAVRVDEVVRQFDDIDTAVTTLTFEDGSYALIDNSRKAAYGYDQRLEVFGDKGMIQVENNLHHRTVLSNQQGIQHSLPLDFFMDRYANSYRNEMEIFINALIKNQPMPVQATDGLQATRIALAAKLSVQQNRPVRLDEIKAE
jgi:myo-inositol 2-dehydrogenase / D-chiro-inositol 1-dehydrogenase